MEKQNSILTYEEMQDLLVDYVFNRISKEDKELFDISLHNYKDIQKEVADVRTVFSRLDKMDIDKKVSQHTRNLSVKVNQRMASNNKSKRFRMINKYLIPTFGLAVIIILFMTHDFNIKDSTKLNKKTAVSQYFIKFDENDFIKLDDVDISNNLIYSDDYLPEFSSEELNNNYNETLKEYFSDGELDKIKSLKSIGFNSQFDMLEQLYSLDEDNIQLLLQEIQDAKFNS